MIKVQREDFDVGLEMKALHGTDTGIGGICSFVGTVRQMSNDTALGDSLSAMTLEHYPGMTEKALSEIEAEANARWDLSGSLIIHRYGRLEPGEQIVLVMTASAHRQVAFDACQFLIDWLKTKAPFWKLEEGEGGNQDWVDAKDSDDAATDKWDQSGSPESDG